MVQDLAYAARLVQRHRAFAAAGITLFDVATMEDRARRITAGARYRSGVLAVSGLLTLVLTCAGLYAIAAGRVAQRQRELAIRLAVGANPRALVSLGRRRTALIVAIGMLVGLASAAAAARLLEHSLFELSPWDPLSFAAGSAILAVAAVIAAYLPARHAARVDPLPALRAE